MPMPMPTQKECPEAVPESEPIVETKRKKFIPSDLLNKWIGPVKNHEKTDQFHVAGNYFRVNVWTRISRPDNLMDTFHISQSYYVEYKNGAIKDKTL